MALKSTQEAAELLKTKDAEAILPAPTKKVMERATVETRQAGYMDAFIPAKFHSYIQRKIDKNIAFWCDLDKETHVQRKPVALIGESGSGKNYSVENYAAEMGLPFLTVPCDDSQVLKELLGFWKAEGGSTVWCEGLLSQFLKVPSVVLFDEINCMPSGKSFMLHELLQNRKLFIKDAPKDQALILVHPECRLLVAMNPPTTKYSGTNRLNTALANRAAFIEVKPFKDDEILSTKTGNAEVDAQIIKFYREVSNTIRQQSLRVSISKRNIDTIAEAVKSGLDVGTAVMQGFCNSALSTASKTEQDALMNIAVMIFGATKFSAIVKE